MTRVDVGLLSSVFFFHAVVAVGSEVEFNLSIDKGFQAPAPVHGFLHATPAGKVGSGEDLEPVDRRVEIPGRVALDLQPGVPWIVELDTPGYWTPPEVLVPTPSGERAVNLVLLPTSKIVGRLQIPSGEPMPTEIKVRFESSPGQGEIPQTTLECPVAQGRWLCQVPVGELDLRFRAKGFVSHFRWGIPVGTGQATDLGTLALHRGASLVGRVEVGEGGGELEPANCVVAISPQEAGTSPPGADQRRFRGLRVATRVNERGFFHFEAIAPGSYTVTVEQRGFATAQLFPVTVLQDAETEIRDPLVLEPPLTLEVDLEPPVDWLDEPWTVLLLKRSEISGSAEQVAERHASNGGKFEEGNLAPGEYVVMVRDSAGAGMGLREFELSRDSSRLFIRLDLVWVEGEVRIGDEPLSAELVFGGRFSPEKVTMVADDEGEFFGYLPREGDWLVLVYSEDPPVTRNVPAVEVRTRHSSTAQVRIELPDTELLGEVVDDEDKQIPGALVRLYEEGVSGVSGVRTDEEGAFAFRGLGEGSNLVSAESYEGTSDEVLVDLVAGRTSAPVKLVLRKQRTLVGRVLSPSGGVPRAKVMAVTYRHGIPQVRDSHAITDILGLFELQIPASATHFQLTAFPPGYTLTVLPVAAVQDEPLIVQVQPHGGALTFKLEEPIDWRDSWTPRPALFFNGVALPWYILKTWMDINAVSNPDEYHFVVPRLATGNYDLCLIPASPQTIPALLVPSNCSPGSVAPYSESVVEVAMP